MLLPSEKTLCEELRKMIVRVLSALHPSPLEFVQVILEIVAEIKEPLELEVKYDGEYVLFASAAPHLIAVIALRVAVAGRTGEGRRG
jgi:hypothetical protein